MTGGGNFTLENVRFNCSYTGFGIEVKEGGVLNLFNSTLEPLNGKEILVNTNAKDNLSGVKLTVIYIFDREVGKILEETVFPNGSTIFNAEIERTYYITVASLDNAGNLEIKEKVNEMIKVPSQNIWR